MSVHQLAGKVAPLFIPDQCPPADLSLLHPPTGSRQPGSAVAFGTSGHRGSSLEQQLQ